MGREKFSTTESVLRSTLNQVHQDRETGNLQKAQNSYHSLKILGTQEISVESALWINDLLMVKGNIIALQIKDRELEAVIHNLGPEFKGARWRLLGLTQLYLFDFELAANYFDLAKDEFEKTQCSEKLGLARTNTIEILAHTRPADAIDIANDAINLQTSEIELGKIYTALGWAHSRLNNNEDALNCFRTAEDHLRAGKYWFGIARNDLAKAAMLLRTSKSPLAKQLLNQSVEFLLKTNAYPSLVLLACKLLEQNFNTSSEEYVTKAQSMLKLPEDCNLYQNIDTFIEYFFAESNAQVNG